MPELIGQRELRNDNADIMRRVEAGESFTVTRNGKPVADLIPHQTSTDSTPVATLGEVQATFQGLPPIDVHQWYRDRDEADSVFGTDDPLEDPWRRGNA